MGWLFRNDRPIYLQIADRLEGDILSGKLPKGSRLPSVRETAAKAQVNPNTVQRAMQELEARGLVTANRTLGRLVTEEENVIGGVRQAQAARAVREFCAAMKALGLTQQEIYNIISEEW